jgi:hypothetical protein
MVDWTREGSWSALPSKYMNKKSFIVRKTIKVEFISNAAHAVGLAYVKGEVADLKEELAKQVIEDGYALEVRVESDLPKDFPKRDLLIESGLTRLEDVQKASDKDLEALKGVGEKTVEEIRDYLSDAPKAIDEEKESPEAPETQPPGDNKPSSSNPEG